MHALHRQRCHLMNLPGFQKRTLLLGTPKPRNGHHHYYHHHHHHACLCGPFSLPRPNPLSFSLPLAFRSLSIRAERGEEIPMLPTTRKASVAAGICLQQNWRRAAWAPLLLVRFVAAAKYAVYMPYRYSRRKRQQGVNRNGATERSGPEAWPKYPLPDQSVPSPEPGSMANLPQRTKWVWSATAGFFNFLGLLSSATSIQISLFMDCLFFSTVHQTTHPPQDFPGLHSAPSREIDGILAG
ncbi:hypothetical protein QBC43DRAFT_93391 [Cladorrhinum sp. PSN259]|nr:hypothetical protein QBC43DRAFT_93391 [Cladorrhinum sp. PSN259]